MSLDLVLRHREAHSHPIWSRHQKHKFWAKHSNNLGGLEYMVRRLEQREELNAHTGCVNTVRWNSAGNMIVSGSDDTYLGVWRLAPDFAKRVCRFETAHMANIFHAVFVPGTNDDEIVSCALDNNVCYNRLTKNTSERIGTNGGSCHKLCVVDAHVFLTCSEDGTVRLIDLRDPETVNPTNDPSHVRNTLALMRRIDYTPPVVEPPGDPANESSSPNSTFITSRAGIPKLTKSKVACYTMAMHPLNNNVFAVGCRDRWVRLFDRRHLDLGDGRGAAPYCLLTQHVLCHKKPSGSYFVNEEGVTGLAWSYDGRELVGTYSHRSVALFDLFSPRTCADFSNCYDVVKGLQSRARDPVSLWRTMAADSSEEDDSESSDVKEEAGREEEEEEEEEEEHMVSAHDTQFVAGILDAGMLDMAEDADSDVLLEDTKQDGTEEATGASSEAQENEEEKDSQEDLVGDRGTDDDEAKDEAMNGPRATVEGEEEEEEEEEEEDAAVVLDASRRSSLSSKRQRSDSEEDATRPSKRRRVHVEEEVKSAETVAVTVTAQQAISEMEQELDHAFEAMEHSASVSGDERRALDIIQQRAQSESAQQGREWMSRARPASEGQREEDREDLLLEWEASSSHLDEEVDEVRDTSRARALATPTTTLNVPRERRVLFRRRANSGGNVRSRSTESVAARWKRTAVRRKNQTKRALNSASTAARNFSATLKEKVKQRVAYGRQGATQLGNRLNARFAENEDYLPVCLEKQLYRGHRTVETIKEVNFFGPRSEYVISGSDCGHVFIWRKKDAELVNILQGDGSITNVVQGNPVNCSLVTSGLDNTVKYFLPTREEESEMKEKEDLVSGNNDRSTSPVRVPASLLYLLLRGGFDMLGGDEDSD